MDPVPWHEAWHAALYAPGTGFYRGPGGPAAHFTTATHGPTGAVLAGALLALPEHAVRVVVDVGAGRGELATHLAAALDAALDATLDAADHSSGSRSSLAPGRDGRPRTGADRVRVVAVDVVDRPEGLDERVEWVRSPGGSALPDALGTTVPLDDALVVAHEWLDVVPCPVAQVDDDGVLRVVLVDPATGEESLGRPLGGADLAWAQAHWPAREPGERVEVGRPRDRAFADLAARIGSGTLVAVDYGHLPGSRPPHGTLTGFAHGRECPPVPDGSCDVTAHVAVDTLGADAVTTQRETLRGLGVLGRTPPHDLAAADPLGYLAALELASAETALLDPSGFGAFWWAVRHLPTTS